jgi:hypothetical protein
MMRQAIIATILLSVRLSATTYCVDSSAGSDSNPGTATAVNCTGTVSAWQTIAHVNAQSFSPGDSILFQSGDTWAEELIPPSSGSSGNPITFGSYGSGAMPVITGSGTRIYAIYNNGQSYLSFIGLETTAATSKGIYSLGGTGVTFLNGITTLNNGEGLRCDATTNVIVNGYTATSNQESGLAFYQATNLLVTHSTAIGNVTTSNDAFAAGIKIHPGSSSTNVVVQYSTSASNGNGQVSTTGSGIWADTVGNGFTTRFNTIYNNNVFGIAIDADNYALSYYNISYGNGAGGIVAYADGATSMTGNQIYNNTVWGNGGSGIQVLGPNGGSTAGGCESNLIKNNISEANTNNQLLVANGCENPGADGSGNVYTYNAFGVQASNFIEWGVGTYYSTYSAWETATGNCGSTGCSHSVESNPLLVSPSTGNFYLQPGSPALAAGLYIAGVSTSNPPNIGALGLSIGGASVGSGVIIGSGVVIY